MTMAIISHRKWFVEVLVLLTVSVALIVVVNCVVDPYGILRSDFNLQFELPNYSYVKTKYLLSGKGRFDSLLFGSSRVNFIDTAKVPGGAYYNYWYPEGVPAEHLAYVKLLLERGMKIRNIAVGLDDFSYMVDPEVHRNNLQRQPHPLVSGKSRLVFYREYFLHGSKFVRNLKKFVLHAFLKRGSVRDAKGSFDVYETGRMYLPLWEERIERDPVGHVKEEFFSEPKHYEGDRIEATLRDIRELANVAGRNGIRLTMFINPIHRTTYLDTNLSQLFTFKKRLAQITDYYDFSGLNPVTTNNYYYYETSHYRPMIGDMMMKRMFGYPPVAVIPGFGTLVTRENIEVHLRGQCNEIQASYDSLNKTNETFINNNCSTQIRYIGLQR